MIRLSLLRWLQNAAGFQKRENGLVAMEFALIGPVLVFSLVAMADVGLAVRDRMALDHIVRVGAQNAAGDSGTEAVLRILEVASKDSLTRSASAAALSVGVVQECACPEAPAIAVDCATTCAGQSPTFIYYLLRADTVAAGMLLPDRPIMSRARVQVR